MIALIALAQARPSLPADVYRLPECAFVFSTESTAIEPTGHERVEHAIDCESEMADPDSAALL